MIDLARRLRPYGLLVAAVVLVVAAVRYVDLDTVEWILRGAPSVKAERPSGSITVQGTDFSLDSFRQLLSRDGITPIYDPKFVSAAKASFGDNDLVMGVTINGESKAYPVGMLNFREMVIDEVGGVPILVTW